MADESLSACVAEIKSRSGKFYVYILSRPCGSPFYVGCSLARPGRAPRLLDHEKQAKTARKSLKCDIIRKIWREGGEVLRIVDSWHDGADGMFLREMELIKLIGRRDVGFGPLANGNDGGTGALNPSSATLATIRSKNKAAWTPEMRAAAAERAARVYAESPERRERFGAMAKKAWEDDKIRAAGTERGLKNIKKMHAANAVIASNPVLKKKHWDKIAAKMRTPEVRKALSDAQSQNWQDPAYRATQSARLANMSRTRSPEVELRRVAAIRAFHAAKRAAKE